MSIPPSRLRRLARLAVLPALVVVLGSTGCGSGSDDPLTPGPPVAVVNDTPANALAFFASAYARRDLEDYAGLLAGDFHVAFSPISDPDFVGTSWFRAEERQASGHLFTGFTNADGYLMPAVTNLVVTTRGVAWFPDPAHPDSAGYYAVAAIDTISFSGKMDGSPFRYLGRYRLGFVRGDAAVLADTTQTADSTRWYLRRWEDVEAYRVRDPIAATASSRSAGSHDLVPSWSRIKFYYLQ